MGRGGEEGGEWGGGAWRRSRPGGGNETRSRKLYGQPVRGSCRYEAQSAAIAQGCFSLFPRCSARVIGRFATPWRTQSGALPVALHAISSLRLGSFPCSNFDSRLKITGQGESVCQSCLRNASENMLQWKYAQEEGEFQAAVGVSAEFFRGDLWRCRALPYYPRNEAARIPMF